MPSSFGNFWITGIRSSQRLRVLMCWSMAEPRRNLNPSWWFGSGRHHDVRAGGVAADQVLPLDRRAGGTAADHAAALEHIVKLR